MTLRLTPLNAAHKALGAKMVPFGGWEMPVWYASAREEHLAVRQAAGLFDVTHMGVLDARGPDAGAWLDSVASNDVSKLAVGKSHYAYLLDDAGAVVDDIMIYRIESERYLVVVNAANDDKDQAWLRSRLNGACALRDLRSPAAGSDMRVDIALQGRAALPTLSALMSAADAANLAALPWAGVLRCAIAGCDVFLSRTGYTGERVAYEIFAHPDQTPALWNALLEAGAPHGVRACGLAARDSLRIEAGLPLYGHELAGPLNLTPAQIGFDKFVKLNKAAAFCGRDAYAAQSATANGRAVRFKMQDKGVRPSKLGDPALDKRGRVIGTVLSCAQGSDGYLVGIALLEGKTPLEEGAAFGVVPLPERMPEPLKPFAPFGGRALVPDAATVLSRFPKREG